MEVHLFTSSAKTATYTPQLNYSLGAYRVNAMLCNEEIETDKKVLCEQSFSFVFERAPGLEICTEF